MPFAFVGLYPVLCRGMRQSWLAVRNAVVTFVLFAVTVFEHRRCTQLASAFDPKHPPPCVITEGEREVVRLFLVVLVCMEPGFAIKVEYKGCPSEAFGR